MARPRHNSNPEAEQKTRQAMVALRLACKIPRTAFALIIGIGAQALQEKEKGRIRFRPEEIAAAKAKIGAHQIAVSNALDQLKS